MGNKRDIKLLECTLRDGGLGLEDAAKNGLSRDVFSLDTIASVAALLGGSGLDIVEIGSIEISKEDKRGYAIYQNIEEISKTAPEKKTGEQMFAALYRGPDTPMEDIPAWRPGLCEVNRVILRYSELQKSLDFCAGLSRKGYKVFVQPMLTMRYTQDELQHIIRASNEMNAYALYFVDSYGYMQAGDVQDLFRVYDEGLDPEIRIGFHAHNNMNLAFSNALTFLAQETERGLIVDSCLLGMGQGAGNLQTEIISQHLNGNFGKAYDFGMVLDACEVIEKYWTRNTWGYSLTHLLPAIHKVAYKYAVDLRFHYGLTARQIDRVFRDIPEELRHRYTPENAVKLLEYCGMKDAVSGPGNGGGGK